MNENLHGNKISENGLTKEKIVNRIMKSEANIYYKKDAISEIIGLYIEELKKELMDGGKVNIPGIGVITTKIRQPAGINNLPNCENPNGENMPQAYLHFRINNKLRQNLNRRLMSNLKHEHKLQLSEGKPPLRYVRVDWSKVDSSLLEQLGIEEEEL